MTKNIICFFLCLCVWGAEAQETSSSVNWKRDQKIAEQHLEEKDFKRAADHFYSSASATNGNTSSSLFYKAGTCYKEVGNFRRAALAFRSVIERDADWENDAVYQLAICQKYLENYDEAISGFKLFLHGLQGESLEDQQLLLHKQIAGCLLAQDLQTSKKEADFQIRKVPATSNAYSKQQMGSWTGGEATTVDGLPDHSEGNFFLSEDKQRLFYSIQEETGNQRTLYVRLKKAGEWLDPEKLHSKINLHNVSNDFPFVFLDEEVGEVLLFCSDRDDGEGGMDIWSSIIKKDEDSFLYTAPKNLGHKINSDRDEITPYYDADLATLYFSSNGKVNIGGFDVYKSIGRANSWSRPKHLGTPVNSGGDDFYFQIDRMVSNRPIDEVADFQLNSYRVSQQVEMLQLYGQVLDNFGNPMSDVKLILNDYTNNFPIDEQVMDAKDGKYSFSISENRTYILRAEKPGFKTIVTEVTSFALNEIVELRQDIEFGETGMLASVNPPMTTQPDVPTGVIPDPTPHSAAFPDATPTGIAPDAPLPHAAALPDATLPNDSAPKIPSDVLAGIIPGPAPDQNGQKAPKPDWIPKDKPIAPSVAVASEEVTEKPAPRPDWLPATKPKTTIPDLPESVAHTGVHPAVPHNSVTLPKPTADKAANTELPIPSVAPDQLGKPVAETSVVTPDPETIIPIKEEMETLKTEIAETPIQGEIEETKEVAPASIERTEPVAKAAVLPATTKTKAKENQPTAIAATASTTKKAASKYKARTYEEIMRDIEKNKEDWNKKRTANSRDNANYEEHSSW